MPSTNRPARHPRPPVTPPPPPPPPPPTGDPFAVVTSLVQTACPKYIDTGELLTDPVNYSFGNMVGVIRTALGDGITPRVIANAIIGLFSGFATNWVPAGSGGPGGWSHSLAWGQGTGEYSDAALKAKLYPHTAPKPPAPPSGPVNPGAGPAEVRR